MIHHDGYGEEDLSNDLENSKNIELEFDDINKISFKEEIWGSALYLEYEKNGKKENFHICNCSRLGKISCKRAYKVSKSRLGTICPIY